MSKLHLKQPGFTYSPCGAFSKHCGRIQISTESVNLKHSYRNELDMACFTHDAAYLDSKDLTKRTISDRILKGRAMKFKTREGYAILNVIFGQQN